MNRNLIVAVVGLVGANAFADQATGQTMRAVYASPTLDRWMYPFNQSPGTRTEIATFGATLVAGFDDRDGQLLIGYDTTLVPAGLALDRYRIQSISVTATIAQSDRFVYDPTHDIVQTYFDPMDPMYMADSDVGRPIGLFACGYRNGFDLATFQETSPFGGAPVVPPSQGARNIFVAAFDETGAIFDGSNHVREQFELEPMAIGQTAAAVPGALVKEGDSFTFEVALNDPNTIRYLREGLSAGRINLMISSLHFAFQGSSDFPIWYSRENILGTAASLDLSVVVAEPGDWNGDGQINSEDFFAFLNDFFAGSADFNADGQTNSSDFFDYLNAFFGNGS